MEKKLLDLLADRDKTIVSKVLEDTIKTLKNEFKKAVEEAAAQNEWDSTSKTIFQGLFPDMDVEKHIEDLNFDEATEILSHTNEALTLAKAEAIPEELKVFFDEDAELNKELLGDVNVSLEQIKTNKEFEEFKGTAFAKGLKEGFEISLEKYQELKANANPTLLEGILDGTVKENAFIGNIFRVEEEAVEEVTETPEERINRLKKEAEVKQVELSEEDKAAIQAHEQDAATKAQIDFLVKSKQETLENKFRSIPDEEEKSAKINAELNEYKAQVEKQFNN